MSKYITKKIGEYTISFSMEEPTLIFKNCECKSDNQKITNGEAAASVAQAWIGNLLNVLEHLPKEDGKPLNCAQALNNCAKILQNCLEKHFDDHRPFNSSFNVEMNETGLKLRPHGSSAVVSIEITDNDFKKIHDLFVRTLRSELLKQVKRADRTS